MVLVQPSAYGRDNTCMLDAMQSLDPAIRRGIVDIDENADDSEFARLNALGVRGVRINVNPIKPSAPGFSETMRRRIARLDARCSELGWSLDFLLPGWLTAELLPDMKGLRSNFSVAHLGMNLARDGITTAGFTGLVDLLKHGEGRCWVKLTGTYRISTQPGFDDVTPLVQTLSQAAPDRLIWGSDYPHLSFAENDTVVSVQPARALAAGSGAPSKGAGRQPCHVVRLLNSFVPERPLCNRNGTPHSTCIERLHRRVVIGN